MFARFDENPTLDLQDIKKQNVTDARTHARTDGQRENSIPPTNKVWGGGYKNITIPRFLCDPYLFLDGNFAIVGSLSLLVPWCVLVCVCVVGEGVTDFKT